jgi:hypothetical protein
MPLTTGSIDASGVVMKTASAMSATSCELDTGAQPGTLSAKDSADDALRELTATTR